MKIVRKSELPLDAIAYIEQVTLMACTMADTTSKVLPGSTTLNELRIVARIVLATCRLEPISVTSIARELKMPKSTVSCFITDLISMGWIEETVYASDRRRRDLKMSSATCDGILKWANKIDLDQKKLAA